MSDWFHSPRTALIREAYSVTNLPQPNCTLLTKRDFWDEISAPDELGSYYLETNSIWIAQDSESPAAVITLLHEYAHCISNNADSRITLKIKEIIHIAFNSPEEKKFKKADRSVYDVDYLLDKDEVWARAIAQYVGTHPDQSDKVKNMWTTFYTDPENLDGLAIMQWSTEHFAPIRAKIDQQFS